MHMTVRMAMLCASHFQQVLSSLMWEINSHSTVWAKLPPVNIDALVPYHREKNQCMLPAAPRTLPHSNTGQEEGKMDYPTSIQTDRTCQSAAHLSPSSYLQPKVQQPCSSQQSPCGSPQLGTQGRAVPAPSGYWIHALQIRGWSWDPTVPKQWNTQATWEVSAEESSAAHVVLI